MAQQKVELRKIRDFSENLNDTFVFIKQEFKPLLICFLGIVGVFMLAAAIIQGVYQNEMGNMIEDLLGGNSKNSSKAFEVFNSTYSWVGLLAWVNIIAMQVALTAYVKVYDRKDRETPTMPEVWQEFRKYFFKVLIYSIPITLLIIIGLVFCIAPGVYFWVVLMPFSMILMVEDKGFTDAFSRCYVIIKDNFWQSFGIYIIAFLIYYFASAIIGSIIGLIAGAISYFTTKDISTTVVFVTSVLNIFSYVFYIIYFIAAILNYYSLTEKYDGTGILKRLNNLGGSGNNFNNIEEQY
jgi:hypothetical protein